MLINFIKYLPGHLHLDTVLCHLKLPIENSLITLTKSFNKIILGFFHFGIINMIIFLKHILIPFFFIDCLFILRLCRVNVSLCLWHITISIRRWTHAICVEFPGVWNILWFFHLLNLCV